MAAELTGAETAGEHRPAVLNQAHRHTGNSGVLHGRLDELSQLSDARLIEPVGFLPGE